MKLLTLPTVPWSAIGLATLLFVVGGILLAIGILIKIGQITSEVGIKKKRVTIVQFNIKKK